MTILINMTNEVNVWNWYWYIQQQLLCNMLSIFLFVSRVFISRSTIQCLLIWLFDGTELDRSDNGVQRHFKKFYGKFFLYINIFIHYIIYVWGKNLTVNCISFDDIKYVRSTWLKALSCSFQLGDLLQLVFVVVHRPLTILHF